MVVAVCLTADRPDMTRQAVASFRAQTYPAKRMYIFDSGDVPAIDALPDNYPEFGIVYHNSHTRRPPHRTIGELRNEANEWCAHDGSSDIICHWDSDDWSHPNRISEQVALLHASGAECVGFNEMLFWREPTSEFRETEHLDTCTCGTCGPGKRTVITGIHSLGEAWLYTNRSATWALGTSLCYWRRTWERAPFAALNSGEDTEWFNRVKVMATHSFVTPFRIAEGVRNEPRMVARIHAGNAGNPAYWPEEMATHPHHWRRVPEWNDYCRGVFAK
jgi:glycosyltransferase involved in cell wall biosynthesis